MPLSESLQSYNLLPVKAFPYSVQLVIEAVFNQNMNAFATSSTLSLFTLYKVDLTTEHWIIMDEVVNILRYFDETT